MESGYHEIVEHYENCLAQYGDTHRGVDWPDLNDANKRYCVMLEVVRREPNNSLVSVLDFGCGASHLFEYILQHAIKNIRYSGLDLSQKFINLSRQKFPQIEYYQADIIKNSQTIPMFDYILMNGVLTEKRNLSFDEMWHYSQKLLSAVFEKCNSGIAFNVMAKAVDWERNDLFHLPMDTLAYFLVKNLTRNFVIRNDYGLYEYTVYVYK